MQDRIAATLVATLLISHAHAQPNSARVPAGFQTVTALYGYSADNPQPLTAPLIIDMATGAGTDRCPMSAWTGAVTYLNTEAGTLNYWGTGFWCLPLGFGTVQYPDGSTYFGTVTTYLASASAPFQRDQVRLAVREGFGQAHQPATGQQWVGEFQRDGFVRDLGQNPAFTAAYLAATNSVTDRAAPQLTSEIRDLMAFDPSRAAIPGRVTGMPGTKRILPAVLQSLEGIAELEVALARYYDLGSGPKTATTKQGFFTNKCLAEEGQDAVLADTGDVRVDGRYAQTWLSRRYIGEHKKCLPQGIGRIEYTKSGDVWIGPVTWLKTVTASKGRVIPSFDVEHKFPVPDGLGYWYHKRTDQTMILSLRYSKPKGGVFFIAAWGGEMWNGRFVAVIDHKSNHVVVYDDKNPLDWRGRNILTEADVPGRLDWDRDGTMYLTNGASIRGRMDNNEPHQFWKPFTWQHAELGITLRGELDWANDKSRTWKGPYFVELTKQYKHLAPGHYIGDTQRFNLAGVPWNEPSRLLEQELGRIDAQQFATFAQRHEDSYLRRIADEKAKAKSDLERTLAQERAEQQAWEREERARRDERDAAFRSAMMGAMNDLKQTVDSSVADLEASRQRNQDAINFSNQLAAQQAEQDRRNREEQQRRDREAREATQAYELAQAQSRANTANAMSAAERQRQLDAQRAQQLTAQPVRQSSQLLAPGGSSGAGGSGTASRFAQIAPVDHSQVMRCAELHRAAQFSQQNVWDCFGNKDRYPNITAMRDAEAKCNAQEHARIAPAVAAYRAECPDTTGKAGAVGQ